METLDKIVASMARNSAEMVEAVEHSLAILEALQKLNGARLSELTDVVDISKSTIYSHLTTLREHSYVTKNGNVYDVGLRCLGLGGYAQQKITLYQQAQGPVQTLAQQTEELAIAAVMEQREALTLYHVRGDQAVVTDHYLGVKLPLHCTASGKAMLASIPPERREYHLNQSLERYTEHTITDIEELLTELEDIREQGYALENEERIAGMRGIGAPIQNPDTGDVHGALAVSGPLHRIDEETFTSELPRLVKNITRELEINMIHKS